MFIIYTCRTNSLEMKLLSKFERKFIFIIKINFYCSHDSEWETIPYNIQYIKVINVGLNIYSILKFIQNKKYTVYWSLYRTENIHYTEVNTEKKYKIYYF